MHLRLGIRDGLAGKKFAQGGGQIIGRRLRLLRAFGELIVNRPAINNRGRRRINRDDFAGAVDAEALRDELVFITQDRKIAHGGLEHFQPHALDVHHSRGRRERLAPGHHEHLDHAVIGIIGGAGVDQPEINSFAGKVVAQGFQLGKTLARDGTVEAREEKHHHARVAAAQLKMFPLVIEQAEVDDFFRLGFRAARRTFRSRFNCQRRQGQREGKQEGELAA